MAARISLGFMVSGLGFKNPLSDGRGVVLFFAKFGQDSACALRVKECDVEAVGTVSGSLVDEANAFAVAHCQCFAHSVFHLEGYVMNALAAVVEELLYGAFGAGGFQKLKLHFANLQEGCLYFLVFYNFCLVNLQSEHVLEVGLYFVDALNGDA